MANNKVDKCIMSVYPELLLPLVFAVSQLLFEPSHHLFQILDHLRCLTASPHLNQELLAQYTSFLISKYKTLLDLITFL